MKEQNSTKRLALTAMFAALTLLATYVIKIPTPTLGYIHLGDTFVLLSGIFLGPLYGGLAAGIGSGLADLLGGYMIWVPGTFIIKMLTAITAASVYRLLKKVFHREKFHAGLFIVSGAAGEAVMVFGYFLFNIIVMTAAAGGITTAGIASAAAASFAEIPFNLVQGVSGIALASLLYPAVQKATQASHTIDSYSIQK